MNLILFERGEFDVPLPRTDPRAVHLIRTLKRKAGDLFDAGIVNGAIGKGTLVFVGPESLLLRFSPASKAPALDPVHLLVGLPRPQTARKILSEATSLGVASIRFFQSEKGEPGYASSTLWRTGEWRRHLLEGAAQAFDTRLPEVLHSPGLAEAIVALPPRCKRIALDNYEAPARMNALRPETPVVLAFGSERGWSATERDQLRAANFELAHLGPRVLRAETAIVVAIGLAKSVTA